MANANATLIGYPIFSDVGVLYSPTSSGGSWLAGLPFSNAQAPELYKAARSTTAALADTRRRIDLGVDRSVRVIGLVYRSPERTGAPTTAVRVRYTGVPSSVQGLLFDYEAGDDVAALGGTFARASVATYFDAAGLLKSAASGVIRDAHFLGGTRTVLLENAATNVVLRKRDLSNAAWTKSNATAARDQIGIDGSANTASSLLATAGNATALQAITLASSQRLQSAYVKRLVGAGTIQMTTDNGATWTTVATTAAWTRVTIPAQTLANPTVGFRIVTSGDKIAVDWVQNETGAVPTSPIGTLTDNTATETRAADALSFPYTAAPQASTMYMDFREQAFGLVANTAASIIGTTSTTGPLWALQGDGAGGYASSYKPASTLRSSTVATAAAYGDRVELLATLTGAGVSQLASTKNGTTTVTGATTTADPLPGAWQATTILFLPGSPYIPGGIALASFRITAGVQTLATLQSLVFDSGWLTPFPAGKTIEDTEGENLGAWCVIPTARTLRYVSVQIDDSLNAAAFVDINRVIVAGGIQPATNTIVSGKLGIETATVNTDGDLSVTSALRKPTRRNANVGYDEQSDDDALNKQFEFQRVAGTSRQLVFVWDPTDTTYLHQRTFLATLQQLSQFEANIGNRWVIPYAFREVL